jgi:Dolichyl-phosphate-mannose-protein mannosyltransferase
VLSARRARRSQWGAALDVAAGPLCVVGFYTAYLAMRIQQHGVLWFVHLGRQFLTASRSSEVITPALGWQSAIGYDGQYYFALAADPAHASDYMGGSAGYVYSRAFYPAVSRTVSLGSVDAIPYAMLAVNVFAVVAGTLAIALWLRGRGAPAWPAALFGLYPGLVFTVFRDLTEPLAYGLAACAVLAFDERRPRRLVLSAALFALAALTRETVVPFAVAAAAALAVADRSRAATWRSPLAWRRGVLYVLATCLPLLVWRAVVSAYLHERTQETGTSGAWAVPFHGILSYWPFDAQHRLIVLTVVLPALAAATGALVLLRRRRAPVAAALLLANVLLYVVFLPDGVDVDYGAAGRAAIGVVLAAIYCVPDWWRPGLRRAFVGLGALSWSLAWYLVVATHYGLSGIDLITL